MRAITASALLAGAVLLVAGCDKQGILSLRHRTGEEVVFGINARPETRTVYGTDKEVDGKTIQAIDWIATDGDTQGDLIRIYSPEAVRENVSGGIEHWADYEIAEYVDGDHSVAKIRNVHTNGLAWGSADSYTFYALYPAPSDEDHHSPAAELAGKLTPENGIPNQQVFSEATRSASPSSSSSPGTSRWPAPTPSTILPAPRLTPSTARTRTSSASI